MSLPKVTILLSTYNGEKYIIEQLDSLFAQTYPNISIFIRDDASTDNTVPLINNYIKQHSDRSISWLPDAPDCNLGYQKSFWFLLQNCPESDFYSFCDQDDIWFPDKVELGVQALNNYDRQTPLLYTSSVDYYSMDLQFMGHSQRINLPITLKDVLFYCPAFGFTIMINDSLRQMALSSVAKYDNMPHDNWCLKIAAALGTIIYNDTPCAKYRRHDKTATFSSSSKLKALSYWFRNEILSHSFQEYYLYTTNFMNEFGSVLSSENWHILSLFSIRKINPHIWFKRLFFPHRLRPTLGGEIALRICFLLNR